MSGVLERARIDIAQEQLWRARRRLEGYVGSVGYHPEVVEMLGSVCWRMGDAPSAGRFWFFSAKDSDAHRQAIETWIRQAGGDPSTIYHQLPRKLRHTKPDRFPTVVRQRLQRLHATGPASRRLEILDRRPHRRPRSPAVDMLAFSVITLIGLFCVYCFSVGLAQILALQ